MLVVRRLLPPRNKLASNAKSIALRAANAPYEWLHLLWEKDSRRGLRRVAFMSNLRGYLRRLAGGVHAQVTQDCFAAVDGRLDADLQQQLPRMLRNLKFATLCKPPKRVSRSHLDELLKQLQSLEKAYVARDPHLLLWGPVHPFFVSLHDHPRYQALMLKINLPK
jgi:hypothetical protein